MKKITIIDYDMGNVGSIYNMLDYLGYTDVEISSSKERILESTHLILPGVGSFDEGMRNLKSRDLIEVMNIYCKTLNRPLLGICLGMQLLGVSSEEGSLKGLGLIDFINIKFRLSIDFKVPHMGWNSVRVENSKNPLMKGIDDSFRFYFVHNYHAVCDNSLVLLTSNYGYDFPVGINSKKIFGVQFHPEKSHQYGMKLLENFIGVE